MLTLTNLQKSLNILLEKILSKNLMAEQPDQVLFPTEIGGSVNYW